MNRSRAKIAFRFSKVPVIALYALFFVVQTFFNFDKAQSNPGNSLQYQLHNTSKAGNQNGLAKQTESGRTAHAKIRLNRVCSKTQPPFFSAKNYFVK